MKLGNRISFAAAIHGMGVCLLCLAAPLLLFPTQVPQATAVALGLLALVWIGETVLRGPWPLTPFNGALFLFLAMALVAILVTPDWAATLPKATGLILGAAVFRWIAGMRQARLCGWALALLMLAAAGVWGVGFLGTAWAPKLPALQGWLGRLPRWSVSLPGTADSGINPNQLAGVMALVLPLPVALSIAGSAPFSALPRRLAWLALAAVWGVTLVLTQSRSGWIGGLGGILALVVLGSLGSVRAWQRRAGVVLLLVAIATLAALLIAWGPGGGTVSPYRPGADTETAAGHMSMQGRLEIWSRALYAIQDFPITGCGLGAFRRVVWVLYPLFGFAPGEDIAHAHNVLLQTALDLGIPGLVAYLALVGIALVVGWRVIRRGEETRWLALGLCSGLLGYHLYGLTDALALGSRPHFLFWWMLGLLAALAHEGNR